MYYTTEEIFKKGEFVDKWAVHVDRNGDPEEDGSQEFYFEYKGNEYIVWIGLDNKPLEPNKVIGPVRVDIYD